MDPTLPTFFLPRITSNFITIPTKNLLLILNRLQPLYSTKSFKQSGGINKREAIDSGYSTEIEDEEEQVIEEEEEGLDISYLGKDDVFERTFTKDWLLKLVKRAPEWIEESSEDVDEYNLRTLILDLSTALIASLSRTSLSGSISRPLILPTLDSTNPLLITLHDALPSDLDPSSVGVQSWGSSIILARLIALDPEKFGVVGNGERMLELGAGTGLLSLAWKGMAEREFNSLSSTSSLSAPSIPIAVATDYHPSVLSNLSHNISLNISPSNTSSTFTSTIPIECTKLDWQAVHTSLSFASSSTHSELQMPIPFDKRFNTILAADVVYGTDHAQWLKSCVERFLIKPDSSDDDQVEAIEKLSIGEKKSDSYTKPTFHLIVPLRPTHTVAIASITKVFAYATDLPPRSKLIEGGEEWRLAIKTVEEIGRSRGVGRADEGGYRLFEIGWC